MTKRGPEKLILCLVCILVLQTGAIAQEVLFRSDRSPDSELALQRIAAPSEENPFIKRSRKVRINSASFEEASLQAHLFDDQPVILERTEIRYAGGELPFWTGNFAGSALGSASFVINGNRVSGHLTSEEGNFEIIPLDDNGSHAILEHDISKYGSCPTEGDVPSGIGIRGKQDRNKQGPTIRGPGTVECIVRVMVAYTPAAKQATMTDFNRTMREHVELAVLETNQSYANSNLDQLVELAYLCETNGVESSSSLDDIQDLQATGDGKWDELHALREMYFADVVVLITGGAYENICGRAYSITPWVEENSYCIVEYDCAIGNFTFAHEIGHVQGCRHDIDITSTPFAYAHGFNQGSVFRTIMAVFSAPPRVNFWSNPFMFYPGAGPMGTITFNDNARAVNETFELLSSHMKTPSLAAFTDTLDSGALIDAKTHDTILATGMYYPGSEVRLGAPGSIILQDGFTGVEGTRMHLRITDDICPQADGDASLDVTPVSGQDAPPVPSSYSTSGPNPLNRDNSSANLKRPHSDSLSTFARDSATKGKQPGGN